MNCTLCGANLTHRHGLIIGGGNHSHDGRTVCHTCIDKAGVMARLLGTKPAG